jgi:DNA helicase II / ATP-dependent DNA helicase PcrA
MAQALREPWRCLARAERIHEDAFVRQADLLQLEQIAAGYPSRGGLDRDNRQSPSPASEAP